MKTVGVTDYTNFKAPQKCCGQTDERTDDLTDGRTDWPTTRPALAKGTQVKTSMVNKVYCASFLNRGADALPKSF